MQNGPQGLATLLGHPSKITIKVMTVNHEALATILGKETADIQSMTLSQIGQEAEKITTASTTLQQAMQTGPQGLARLVDQPSEITIKVMTVNHEALATMLGKAPADIQTMTLKQVGESALKTAHMKNVEQLKATVAAKRNSKGSKTFIKGSVYKHKSTTFMVVEADDGTADDGTAYAVDVNNPSVYCEAESTTAQVQTFPQDLINKLVEAMGVTNKAKGTIQIAGGVSTKYSINSKKKTIKLGESTFRLPLAAQLKLANKEDAYKDWKTAIVMNDNINYRPTTIKNTG